MRIGAIFARGSCRALKWTALLGVVFALAAGTAAAQQSTSGVTITGPDKNTVTEGVTATYTVAIRGYVAKAGGVDSPTVANTVTVTLTEPVSDVEPARTQGEVNTDLRLGASSLKVSFETPENTNTSAARLFTDTRTITLATEQDTDAEDEHFTLAFTLNAHGGLDTTAAGGHGYHLEQRGEIQPRPRSSSRTTRSRHTNCP